MNKQISHEEMCKLVKENPDQYEIRQTLVTEMLTDVWKGIITRTTYHADGTVTTEEIPGPFPVMHGPIIDF